MLNSRAVPGCAWRFIRKPSRSRQTSPKRVRRSLTTRPNYFYENDRQRTRIRYEFSAKRVGTFVHHSVPTRSHPGSVRTLNFRLHQRRPTTFRQKRRTSCGLDDLHAAFEIHRRGWDETILVSVRICRSLRSKRTERTRWTSNQRHRERHHVGEARFG